MEWGAPEYLCFLVAALPLLFLAWRGVRRTAREVRLAAGEEASPRRRNVCIRLLRAAIVPAGLLLIVVALCRPQWGVVAQERQTQELDIVVVLDVSRSMEADDLGPTRLAAAKEAVTALVARLAGDRVALVAFAGSAFTVCPLTNDYSIFESVLAQAGPDTIPLPGTSFSAALEEGRKAFAPRGGGGRVLLLISDGEDHGQQYESALQKLRESGIILYTVSAGTDAGALIPLSGGGFHTDPRGLVVKSRGEPSRLRAAATAGGGRYLDLVAGPSVLSKLYDAELASLERTKGAKVVRTPAERFQIPLALALLLLSVEPLFGRRRER